MFYPTQNPICPKGRVPLIRFGPAATAEEMGHGLRPEVPVTPAPSAQTQ